MLCVSSLVNINGQGRRKVGKEKRGRRPEEFPLLILYWISLFGDSFGEAIVIIYINRTSYRSPNSIPEFNEKDEKFPQSLS